jgi:hypothetical protein
MAYDGYRHQVVLFGGVTAVGGTLLDDTWTLQGRAWTRRNLPVHPGAMPEERMVYDDRTHTCLLVGSGLKQDSAQTWSWDGTAWQRLSDVRFGNFEDLQALAVDPNTGQVMLLNYVGNGRDTGSTEVFVWDGAAWAPRYSPSSFPAASSAPLLATVKGGILAVFDSSDGERDTWLWNGATWSRRAAGGTPPYDPLSATMAEDPATGDVVLIGLGDPFGGDASTWLWNGTSWREGTAAPLIQSAYGGTFILATASTVIVIGERSPDSQSNILDVLWTFDGRSWISDRAV